MTQPADTYRAAVTAEYETDLLARRARADQRTADSIALRDAYHNTRREAYLLGLDLPYAETVAIRDEVKATLGWTPEREPRFFPATVRNERRSTPWRQARS